MSLFARTNDLFALLLSGFVLWSVAFVAIYATQAVGCHLGWQGFPLVGGLTLHRTVLIGAFAFFLGLHIALFIRTGKSSGKAGSDGDAFASRAGAHLSLAALAAAVFTFSGVFWLSPCG
jgi:hypothetical protein